jgi:FK506-binding nuclear protein
MDELDYDLSPDDDEFDEDEDEESDELDSLADPRITEVDTDEEEQEDEAPKLVKKTPTKAEAKRGADAVEKPKKPAQKTPNQTKGKRGAEDDADNEDDQKPESLDDIMAKSLKPGDAAAGGEPKLSRRQLKKLKNNAGKAAQPPTNGDDAKQDAPSEGSPSAAKSEKKVQFSKDSDAGRHGEQTDGKKDNKSPGKGEKKDEKKEEKRDEKKNEKKDQKKDQKKGENKAQKSVDDKAESKDNKTDGKSGLGNQRTVQGVIISDGKLGTGPPAKQGSTVSLRYIGKLQSNNRQFDGKWPTTFWSRV